MHQLKRSAEGAALGYGYDAPMVLGE